MSLVKRIMLFVDFFFKEFITKKGHTENPRDEKVPGAESVLARIVRVSF